jgi:hypothetical protein
VVHTNSADDISGVRARHVTRMTMKEESETMTSEISKQISRSIFIRKLTSNIMYPGSSANGENIVKKNKDISCLVNEKVMPCFRLISRVVVDSHGKDELCR